MNWKEYFKITKWKIILFAILMIMTSFIFSSPLAGGISSSGKSYQSLPFYYLPYLSYSFSYTIIHCNYEGVPLDCVPSSSFHINYISLLANMILYYLISCLVIYAYHKVKKK